MIKLKMLTLLNEKCIAESAELSSDSKTIRIKYNGNNKIMQEKFILYALDENNLQYTFLGCCFANNIFNGIFVDNNETVRIIQILNGYYTGAKLLHDNFLVRDMFVNIEYNNLIKREFIINSKINNDNISICTTEEADGISINICSNVLIIKKQLENIFFTYYEMFILAYGGLSLIQRITYSDGANIITQYVPIANKYQNLNKSKLCLSPLFEVRNIDNNMLNKWSILKEKANLSFDVFLVTCSSDLYVELRLSLFLQCIEGICRSIFKMRGEYWEILNKLFIQDREVVKIFSSDDLTYIMVQYKDEKTNQNRTRLEEKILFLAKQHRNYFSHLNNNEYKLSGLDCIYTLEKLMLGFRIRLCEEIGIKCGNEDIKYLINEIDKWYIKNKIHI